MKLGWRFIYFTLKTDGVTEKIHCLINNKMTCVGLVHVVLLVSCSCYFLSHNGHSCCWLIPAHQCGRKRRLVGRMVYFRYFTSTTTHVKGLCEMLENICCYSNSLFTDVYHYLALAAVSLSSSCSFSPQEGWAVWVLPTATLTLLFICQWKQKVCRNSRTSTDLSFWVAAHLWWSTTAGRGTAQYSACFCLRFKARCWTL